MVLHVVCRVLVVPQEAGEGFTGPEEGEGGDPAAGDGEADPLRSNRAEPLLVDLS